MRKTVLLIGLCLFLPTLTSLSAQTLPPNPFDNRNSLSDAFSRLDRALNTSQPTLEDAYFLGRAVAANIFAMYRPYTEDQRFTRYVNAILQTLVINSPRPVAFRGYFAVILDSPEFNAFATPGGHILVTKGFTDAAAGEDMLAAILAHELAHIVLDHGLAMISTMAFTDEAAAMANRAAGFSGNNVGAARLLSLRNSVSGMIDMLVHSGYSQAQEFEADAQAVAILAAAGYNPRALLEVLDVLHEAEGTHTTGFFATHPAPADRIRNVQDVLRQRGIPDTGTKARPRFFQNR